MRTSLPRRLRTPLVFAGLALVVVVIDGAAYGWNTVPEVIPVVLVIALTLFLVGGRDSDAGAVVRRQVDERQAHQRLQVQALAGRALSLAVTIGYLIAVATKAQLWPFAVLLGVLALTYATGWWLYGPRTPLGADSTEAHRPTSD
jgi:hypothetical protein